MVRCIHQAHQAILAFGDRQVPPVAPRTTAVLALVQNNRAYWVHVGDSRLYLVRDGQLLAQTQDHSQARYLRPADGAGSAARSAITRCLGGLDRPPQIGVGPATELHPGDTLLLCSDGLWAQLPQELLLQALSPQHDLDTAVRDLAKEAMARGYPRSDNVTVVAIRWQPAPAGQPADREAENQDLGAAVAHLKNVLRKTPIN